MASYFLTTKWRNPNKPEFLDPVVEETCKTKVEKCDYLTETCCEFNNMWGEASNPGPFGHLYVGLKNPS